MTRDDMQPEFDEFVVANARNFAFGTRDSYDHKKAMARALLARIDSRGGDRSEGRPLHDTEVSVPRLSVAREVSTTPAPKPEPPKQRSAEEILEALVDLPNISSALQGSIAEALHLVRELRQERGTSERERNAVQGAYESVKAERDELQRRTERAKAEWNSKICHCQVCSDCLAAYMFRALEQSGAEPESEGM